MEFFKSVKIDFMKLRKGFAVMSIALVVLGILFTIIAKPEVGIDYTGGSEVAVKFKSTISAKEIRNALESNKIKGSEVKSFGQDGFSYLVRVKNTNKDGQAVQKAFDTKLVGKDYTILKVDKIGPKVGSEMLRTALLAVFASLIMILIYIAFRFEFVFGLGAVFATFHDVIIVMLLINIFNRLGIVDIELNQQILSAILMIIGYSINDTVIIFDRIRENLEKHKGQPRTKIFNISLNETLNRTINTSLTTALVMTAIFIIGGPVLQGFALTMLLGIIFGTYSSVYVASSIVLYYNEHIQKMDIGKS